MRGDGRQQSPAQPRRSTPVPEYAVPVMFTVRGQDRESAARALVTALAAAYVQAHDQVIEAFWLPEMDLQHVDGNDNEPCVMVPLADMVERAEGAERVV